MTLDPAPPVLGGDVDSADGGDGGGGGVGDDGVDGGASAHDEERTRATAHRQWLDRRALERQLHDGAALRISALTLRLGLLRHAVPGAGHEFRQAVEGLQDELHLVLQELRDVAGLLYPPLLDEAGLGPALREVAARCPVPVRIDAPDERFGPAVEGAVYFAVLGCLPAPDPRGDPMDGHTDGRAAGVRPATSIDVVVRRDGDALAVLVTGVDAWHAAPVHDAVRPRGGTVAVGRGAGGGDGAADDPAPITVRIPCA